MKKQIFFTIIIALVCSSTAWAQPGPGKERPTQEEKVKRVTETIESELELDSKKMEEVSKIYTAFFSEMEAEYLKTREAMKEKRSSLILARNKHLKEVLSEQEYDDLMVLMETMRKRRPHRDREPRGGKR